MEIPGSDSMRKSPYGTTGHYQMKNVPESTTVRYGVVPAIDTDTYITEDVYVGTIF